MVGTAGKISGIYRTTPVCWIGNYHSSIRHQPGREGTADVGSGLVDERGQLGLVGGVEEEMAETFVRVHDLYFREERVVHIWAVQREGVVVDIFVDGVSLVGTGEIDCFGVVGYALAGCFLGDVNLNGQLLYNTASQIEYLEKLQGLVLPHLGIAIRKPGPVVPIRINPFSRESCNRPQCSRYQSGINIKWDTARAESCIR